MLVGTKLQHVVAQLALEIVETTGPAVGNQLKPRDDLFWFGKPEILLWLIQFISFQVIWVLLPFSFICVFVSVISFYHSQLLFCLHYSLCMQNSFEMATFIWSLVS